MVQPIDQGSIIASGMALVPNYLDQELKRQLAAAQIGQMQANTALTDVQARAGEQELVDDKAYQAAIMDPRAQTIEGKLEILRRFPRQAKTNFDALKFEASEKDKAAFTRAGEAANLAAAGRWDRVSAKLKEQIAADRAAGQDTSDDEQLLAMVESNDPAKQRQAAEFMARSAAMVAGPEHAAALTNSFGPKLMGVQPGTVVIDERTQQPVYTSPYKPQLVTQTNPDGSTTTFEYTPGQEGGDQSTGGRGGLQNNPGAIKDSPWARAQPGYVGADARGFAVFKNPNAGKVAQVRLLRENYLGKGFNTPRKLIERYAPRGPENSDASVNNYIGHVARSLGIGPDDPIPQGRIAQLATAIEQFENGTWGGSAQGGRVVANSAPPAKKPSETRVVQGRTYYKIDGRWFDNPEGS